MHFPDVANSQSVTNKNKLPKSAKKRIFFICANTNNWYIYKKINNGKKYFYFARRIF